MKRQTQKAKVESGGRTDSFHVTTSTAAQTMLVPLAKRVARFIRRIVYGPLLQGGSIQLGEAKGSSVTLYQRQVAPAV